MFGTFFKLALEMIWYIEITVLWLCRHHVAAWGTFIHRILHLGSSGSWTWQVQRMKRGWKYQLLDNLTLTETEKYANYGLHVPDSFSTWQWHNIELKHLRKYLSPLKLSTYSNQELIQKVHSVKFTFNFVYCVFFLYQIVIQVHSESS